jgi:hypothetical protein
MGGVNLDMVILSLTCGRLLGLRRVLRHELSYRIAVMWIID